MVGHRYASCLSKLPVALCVAALVSSCDSGTLEIGERGLSQTPSAGAAPLDIAQAKGADEILTLSVELRGSMVLPVADTRESALADIVFDRASRRLYAVMQATSGQAFDVHIHEGGSAEVGATVATLFEQDAIYTLGQGVTLSERQAALLESGSLYIDAHTSSHPDGLLRAQLAESSPEVALAPQLDDIQAKVFTPFCAGCHSGQGQTLPGILDLGSVQRSYESLVGVYSINEASLLRVESGNPSDSLLLRKIEGTQEVGSRMPLRGARLGQQTIDAIRDWIAQGAAR